MHIPGSLYRAYPTAALWESTRGSYMLLYALLKRAQHPADAPDRALPLWSRLLAGGGANVLNIACWYPLNTVLHVQQSELPPGLAPTSGSPTSGPPPGSRHAAATARALLAEGGLPRLYRGIGYALLRAGPVAAVIMPSFELVLPRLERLTARFF